jgi:hypothetical protein
MAGLTALPVHQDSQTLSAGLVDLWLLVRCLPDLGYPGPSEIDNAHTAIGRHFT